MFSSPFGVAGILPVEVETVEVVLVDEPHDGIDELLSDGTVGHLWSVLYN